MRRILVVEHDRSVALTLRDGLEGLADCEVSVASNSDNALRLCQQECFDVLITDYKMPGTDGLALATRMRELCPRTRVVMVTAYDDELLWQKRAAGLVQCILDKPVGLETLRLAVSDALARSGSWPESSHSEAHEAGIRETAHTTVCRANSHHAGTDSGRNASSLAPLMAQQPASDGEGRREQGWEGGTMAGERILVVEDEGVVALDVGFKLEDMGYSVCGHVESGEEAIAAVERTRPDLVLMDVKLKGTMDGIQAVEQIQARFDIPVVYLTAYADKLTVARAKETKPLGYVLKPFEIAELRAAIEIALYRHELERRVQESERWLAATLRSIGDGVIATDAQGRVELMNPVAETLTGWRRQEAVGKPLPEVFSVVAEKAHAAPGDPPDGEPARRAAPSVGRQVRLVGKFGRETPIERSVAPIRNDEGDVEGAVLVFRDTSERRRLEEALRQHAGELEARNRELEAFARTVAHELKDPLGRVMGFARLMVREADRLTKQEAVQFLGLVEQNARSMSKIIDQLLLLAEAREREVPVEPLDPASVVAQARQRLAHVISRNRVEIAQPDAWPAVMGYAPWVEAVFVNYLSNAIKYGGRPPRVRLGATVEADERVRLWVQDNGPGIPEEAQARLFVPFTQLDPSSSAGHGLGLSIVRVIAEKLGGEAGVDSEIGRGSTFSLILPGAGTQVSALGGTASISLGCQV